MKIQGLIRERIEELVGKLSEGGSISFDLGHPKEENHGDYATNVAMQCFGLVKSNIPGGYLHKLAVFASDPKDMAEKIIQDLKKDAQLMEVIEKIEVAGPGFINFYLKKEVLGKELELAVREGDNYGKGSWGMGKRVLVEYSSPNIAKRFSVGHFRSTVIGQAIRNLYQFSGWETVGDNHLGDWGTQFGMMIAAVEEKGVDISMMTLDEVEELYVEFNGRIKDNPQLLDKAREAFLRLEQGESKAREIWKMAVAKSMEEFERIYRLIGVRIENSYGESSYEELMPSIIEEAKAKKISQKSEGAWIVEFGPSTAAQSAGREAIPPAMLVKSDGTTTYFTRDLATVKFREEGELKSDLYVYEVGEEQTLHFRQVFAAVEKLGWAKKDKFVHVAHGLILGKDGKKMSTRKGTTVKIEDWIGEIVEKAGAINQGAAAAVGVGAVKYFDLKHAPNTSYRFDMEEALRLDGDSGPYLQYALVRTKAVLAKAKKDSFGLSGSLIMNAEEEKVVRWIYRFGEVVEEAAKNFSPNLVCSYLFELGQRFNGFYNRHQIIGGENEDFRLLLTKATGQVLENGLKLLGIETVEKM